MTELLMTPGTVAPATLPFPFPTDLPYDDGEPLETPLHRWIIDLLCEQVDVALLNRHDYYVGGNMFVHFSIERARNKDFRGPDFFFVDGPDRDRARKYYAVWEEGNRYPDVIVELLSSSTEREDLTTKKDVYERVFKTREYYCYDPIDGRFLGWRLGGTSYEPIAQDNEGRMDCQVLGLKLGPWFGKKNTRLNRYLRFFYPSGQVVPTFAEKAEARAAQAEAQAVWTESQIIQTEADLAQKKAIVELADAEIAKLRAELDSLRQKSNSSAEQP